jgi:NitT/TauT family transport system substrate-binding protein
MKNIFIVAIIVLIFAGGGYGVWKTYAIQQHTEIRISSNPWVGFTPFMYAQEKGWLENTPFKFIWLVDLSDNARLYEKGFTQAFTATQYEYLHFKNKETIVPAFLIDESNGADALLSNRTLEQLCKSKEKVNIYLEEGSLHDDMLAAFIRECHMEEMNFQLIDSSQKGMSALKETTNPLIVMTYEPYTSLLKTKGLHVISSTATLKTFHAVDALFVDKISLMQHKDDYQNLKNIFERAKVDLRKNPKEYYKTVQGYLENENYEDFIASTHQIKWLEGAAPAPIIRTLKSQKINTDALMQ